LENDTVDVRSTAGTIPGVPAGYLPGSLRALLHFVAGGSAIVTGLKPGLVSTIADLRFSQSTNKRLICLFLNPSDEVCHIFFTLIGIQPFNDLRLQIIITVIEKYA
jgi:hypothetical protein